MKDPKKIVTSYAFEVESSLLGRPLATPKRRMAAVLLDLIIASMLAQLGGIILGFIVAILFFIVAIRSRKGNILKRSTRIALAATGACMVFVLCLVLVEKQKLPEEVDADDPEVSAKVSKMDWGAFTREVMSVDYSNSARAQDSLEKITGKFTNSIDTLLNMQVEPPEIPENAGTLLMMYARAYQNQDSTVMDSLHSTAQDVVAGQELANLKNANKQNMEMISHLEDENDDLREIAEDPGFVRMLKATADDLGMAVGWIGMYFVLFLAFWEGRTPGKRLLSLKVVRLNGERLTLWYSFERFGGYAAGFATGLLGFAQVYWDANRQGTHDKIAGTVVLDQREKRRVKYKKLVQEHGYDEDTKEG